MNDRPSNDVPDIDVALRASGAQRTPCVLLLDTSDSMREHGRIDALNSALREFEKAVKGDESLRQQVTLTVITFGGAVHVEREWMSAGDFTAPTLVADGMTPMGEAMTVALASVEELRGKLRREGIPYTKPWIFLMSDGAPNDAGWEQSAAASRQAAEDKRVVIWPIAVPPDANAAALKQFAASSMNVYAAGEAQFSQLFAWLTTSLGALSNSQVGDKLQLAAPTTVVLSA